MLQAKLLSILLAGIMVCGSIPLGFSTDPQLGFGSLKLQIEGGAALDKIHCNNPNHVLVERTNGKLACVTESAAERIGWQILESPVNDLVKDNQKVKTIKELANSNTIPSNSNNFWFPIPDDKQEDFAKKIVAATGGSLTGETNRYGDYKTEPFGWLSVGYDGVNYRIYNFSIEPSQTEKFVRDFMDYMGFEYKEENFHYHETSYHRDGPGNDRQFYNIITEYSAIKFEFFHTYGGTVIIMFNGWINNPDSIIVTITEEQALQYAQEFSNDLEVNMNLLYGYDYEHEYACDLQKWSDPQSPLGIFANKKVIGGVLYYVHEVGVCVGLGKESIGLGDFSHLLLHQDAVNGTDVFIELGASGE